jgi:hypothetical protein
MPYGLPDHYWLFEYATLAPNGHCGCQGSNWCSRAAGFRLCLRPRKADQSKANDQLKITFFIESISY